MRFIVSYQDLSSLNVGLGIVLKVPARKKEKYPH